VSIKSRKSGHTLVEMTVVVTILAAVMSLVVRAQKPFSQGVLGLQDRNSSSTELHLAVDYLTMDLGAAKQLRRENDSQVLIRRESGAARRAGLGKGGSDPGIRYSFADGKLMREDLVTREKIVVAVGMTGFLATRTRGGETRLKLADGIADDDQHTVTLVWRQP